MLRSRPTNPKSNESCVWMFDAPVSKIYVGASMNAQMEALRLTVTLMKHGFEVTSSWVNEDFEKLRDGLKAWQISDFDEKWGKQDYADIMQADTLVLMSDNPSSTGGYHVELGIALATGKNILLVGNRRNVFYHLPQIRFVKEVSEVLGNFLEDHRLRELLVSPVVAEDDLVRRTFGIPQNDGADDVPF